MLPLPNGPISASDARLGSYSRAVSDSLSENTAAVKINFRASDKDSVNFRCRVGGGAPQGWPPSASQTACTVFP